VSSNVKLINRRNFASLYEVTCLNLNPIASGFQRFHRIYLSTDVDLVQQWRRQFSNFEAERQEPVGTEQGNMRWIYRV
jgi:hypothetical protein